MCIVINKVDNSAQRPKFSKIVFVRCRIVALNWVFLVKDFFREIQSPFS